MDQNRNNSHHVPESAIREFLAGCRFSHWHWGYQPIRIFEIALEDRTACGIYNISGNDLNLYRWEDPHFEVRGWNGKVVEESLRPLLECSVLQQPEFGFQLSPSYTDWLGIYDPELWHQVHDVLLHKPAFASTYTQNILPSMPDRITDLLIEIGIRAHQQDFRRVPLGFWPAELAVTPDTVSKLYSHGIRVLILMEDQLDITEKAPLYALRVDDGGTMYVIPYSKEVGARYGYQDNEAHTYAEFLALKQLYGILATGANDLETIGHWRKAESVQFAKWLYTVYLPSFREQGRLSWVRRLEDARPATLKPISSWSCLHGIGRWTGDENCNCDNATIETQREKARLLALLKTDMQSVTEELDQMLVGAGSRWEPVYINWFLSQRPAIARGLPIQQPPGDPMGLSFLRLMNSTVGAQSCSFFFSGKYERGMAHACVRELDLLRSRIPVAA